MRIKISTLIILGFLILGCSGARRFFWLSEKPGSAEAADESGLRSPDLEAPLSLTPEERFEDVQRCYGDALDSAAAGNNIAAQSLFEYAIVNLSDLDADSLELQEEDLDWLRGQLVLDYARFLDQLPVLPPETSPSAVYLSLSEFLGDSVESWEDLIDIVLSPEAPADTAASQRAYPDIPLVVNSYVEDAVMFFQTKGRKVFSRWLERGEEMIPYLTDLLQDEGMPEELVYLSMIESGFSAGAYSRAHASGLWQFISSTARIYGLQVSKYYDERRDPELATRAACRYLKKLYDQFNDWYLAFASYNCGELRVDKIVKRLGVNDYWQIRQHLPRQTRDYVPYYLAARLICQDPERYGFEASVFRPPAETNVVYVDGAIDLRTIAQCANADYELVKALNPALRKGCTPPNAKNFPIRLPKNSSPDVDEKISKAPRRPVKPEKEEKSDWVRHRIRSGESLASIAQKYGVSVNSITSISANKIKNPDKLRVGRYLLIPVRKDYVPSSEEPAVGQPQPPLVTSSEGLTRTLYRVRKGDSLSKIALKHRLQPSDIKTWNHLWGERYIYPGQRLILWTKSSADAGADQDLGIVAEPLVSAAQEGAANPGTYIIRRGDTLWDIAKRFGVSVQKLKEWNGIRSAYHLQPGCEIKLQP